MTLAQETEPTVAGSEAESYQRNWQSEHDCAATFQILASRERNTERKTIFEKLQQAELRHTQKWEERMQALGLPLPQKQSAEDALAQQTRGAGGLASLLLAVEEEERRDVADYTRQLRETDDEETAALLREIILEEFGQAQTLRRLRTQSSPRSALDHLLRRERRTTGSWIGDAIYGVNDGLGAIFGIVSGVSGATLGNQKFVLLSGIAGMVASALSMGAGAYLASKSEREIFEAEMERERAELRTDPEGAKEEMAVLYQLKGIPEDDAVKIAEVLAANEDQFLRTLAMEKLNISEEALSVPVRSAVTGSLSTALGAFIPIIPFFFMKGYPAIIAAAVISLIAHFAVGAAKSMITVRSWWSSGLEMTLVGAVEGVATYLIGIGLGHIGGGAL